MVTKEELKAQQLQAMSVVDRQRQLTSDMYGRIVEAGELVAKARDLAEDVHTAALKEHLADLREMAEELADDAQKVPTRSVAAQPAALGAPSFVSSALAALNAAQPNIVPRTPEGDAYLGTRRDN
jgi:uncharacterized protein YoxC